MEDPKIYAKKLLLMHSKESAIKYLDENISLTQRAIDNKYPFFEQADGDIEFYEAAKKEIEENIFNLTNNN